MLDTPRRHGDRTAPKARPLTIDSIRRECLARIKHDRQACLWQHRGDPLLLGDAPVTLTKRARAVLDDVLERKGEKRARINLDRRHSDLQSEFEETWWTDPRRVLIREEGLDMDCDRGALVDDIPSITPEEEAALMKELEAELRAFEAEASEYEAVTYAETLEREARCVEEASREHEEDTLRSAVDGEDSLVLCPVCGVGWLCHTMTDRGPFFECHKCLTRIADGFDGLGLTHLRMMLARAFQEHLLSGCDAQPKFQSGPQFDHASILICHCSQCNFNTAIM